MTYSNKQPQIMLMLGEIKGSLDILVASHETLCLKVGTFPCLGHEERIKAVESFMRNYEVERKDVKKDNRNAKMTLRNSVLLILVSATAGAFVSQLSMQLAMVFK